MFVPFPPDLSPVRIVKRLNRFVVVARTDGGSVIRLHLPNSGRMQELLVPDALGLAAMDGGGPRSTSGTLLVVQYHGRWVSVDARMPNRLFERCVAKDGLAPFRGYEIERAEASWGRGRIDFLLKGSSPDSHPGSSPDSLPEFSPDSPSDIPQDSPPGIPQDPLSDIPHDPVPGIPQDPALDAPADLLPDLLVETKSCNLVVDGLALFPDAPTKRGTRHLLELAEAVKDGMRAAVVWFVQRDDARRLAAHRDADPAFARAMQEAAANGVELYAYRCHVDPSGVRVIGQIPITD